MSSLGHTHSRLSSIRTRILMVALVPLGFFLATSALYLSDTLATYRTTDAMERNAELFQATSKYVTELQRERGTTARALSGSVARQAVTTQREKTDGARTLFLEALGRTSLPAAAVDAARTEASGVEALRRGTEATGVAASDVIREYSAAIGRLLTIDSVISNAPSTGGVGKMFTSLLVLESGKENAGVLRATVSSLLGPDKPIGDADVTRALSIKAGVDGNLSSRALVLSDASQRRLTAMATRPDWLEVQRTVGVLVSRAREGKFGTTTDTYWAAISGVIDELGGIVQGELTFVIAKAQTARAD